LNRITKKESAAAPSPCTSRQAASGKAGNIPDPFRPQSRRPLTEEIPFFRALTSCIEAAGTVEHSANLCLLRIGRFRPRLSDEGTRRAGPRMRDWRVLLSFSPSSSGSPKGTEYGKLVFSENHTRRSRQPSCLRPG